MAGTVTNFGSYSLALHPGVRREWAVPALVAIRWGRLRATGRSRRWLHPLGPSRSPGALGFAVVRMRRGPLPLSWFYDVENRCADCSRRSGVPPGRRARMERSRRLWVLTSFAAPFHGPIMRRPIRSPWSVKENERLKTMIANGASALRSAAALKRSVLSVRDQACKLGTPFPSIREMKKRFSARERSLD